MFHIGQESVSFTACQTELAGALMIVELMYVPMAAWAGMVLVERSRASRSRRRDIGMDELCIEANCTMWYT